ncbi:MAG: patatin-like phospholipase family protein [Fidelibacterota bacterium]
MRIGLALAGGGARGAAHIGVLQVLHGNGIPLDTVAGSSAGAVAGAMYAATLDPEWMEKRYREFLESDLFKSVGAGRLRRSPSSGEPESFFNQIGRLVKDKLVITIALGRQGIIGRDKLEQIVRFLVPVRDFSELRLSLKVVVTDLNTGGDLIVSQGDLVEAVVQSSSIPGYMWPWKKDGQVLVDGGVSCPVPINTLLNSGLDFTIAVDIARRKMKTLDSLNVVDVIARAEQITVNKLSDELVRKADFVIEPDVSDAHWTEFDRFDEFLENGRQATVEALPLLREQLRARARWGYRLRQWLKRKVS